MHYVDEGSGPAIIMLHGNPTWSFYYRELIKGLRNQYRVIAPDHIGCGLSDKPQDYTYTLATHIDNLARLIDHLRLENVTLAGHDWGGAIGFGWATRNPDQVTRFVVFNTAAFFGRMPFRIRVCRWPILGDVLVRRLNLFARSALWMARRRHERMTPEVAPTGERRLVKALRLNELGCATNRFLSYGAYAQNGGHLFKRGIHTDGAPRAFDPSQITEDLASGWFAHRNGPRHPSRGVTIPDADADGYTWCKAPRLAGEVFEVGALARQLVDGHPLICDLVKASGGNVANRVIARLLEIARATLALEEWTRLIIPHEPFYTQGEIPAEAEGAGLIEAARGSLGHWMTVRNGRILNYQIIAPTTWNFSPRDGCGVPGACEQALVGAPVREGETDPVAVQHIVRSFDPCMVCTVH